MKVGERSDTAVQREFIIDIRTKTSINLKKINHAGHSVD